MPCTLAPTCAMTRPVAGANVARGTQLKKSLLPIAMRPIVSRVAGQLRSPHKRNTPVQAIALPALVPMVARAVTAGVLFYASMNWVFYRGTRKDTEKYMKENEDKQNERKKLLNKLNGKKDDDAMQ